VTTIETIAGEYQLADGHLAQFNGAVDSFAFATGLFGKTAQFLSADSVFAGLFSDQSDCATEPLFRYSLPSTIAHLAGSMSAMRFNDIAYAQ
jgi:hypothetical protein